MLVGDRILNALLYANPLNLLRFTLNKMREHAVRGMRTACSHILFKVKRNKFKSSDPQEPGLKRVIQGPWALLIENLTVEAIVTIHVLTR